MKIVSIAASVLLTAIMPNYANAADAINISEYVGLKKSMDKTNDKTIIIYMSGVADALYGSNTVLSALGNPNLYCANISRPLSATELMSVTDKVLAEQIRKGNVPPSDMAIAVVAANAVSASFPCK